MSKTCFSQARRDSRKLRLRTFIRLVRGLHLRTVARRFARQTAVVLWPLMNSWSLRLGPLGHTRSNLGLAAPRSRTTGFGDNQAADQLHDIGRRSPSDL
jgi:hypothetical protein